MHATSTAANSPYTDPVRPRLLRPQLPRDLETVCLKCLEKDPARRYPSADALARFRDGRPITARPVGAVERGWKWCRRRPLLAGMAAGLVVAVGGGTVGIAREYFRAERQRVQAVQNLERSDRMLGHSRQSLAEMVELGRQRACNDKSVDAGYRILEIARGHYQRMLTRDEDPELRRQTVLLCLRLADIQGGPFQDKEASHARLIEALEHVERLGGGNQLEEGTRRVLQHRAVYMNQISVNSGGPTDRWAWILDRAESLLLEHRAVLPNDPDAAVLHVSLWTQRAVLAANAEDDSGEADALEQAVRVAAAVPAEIRAELNIVIHILALSRVTKTRLAAGRIDDATASAEQAVEMARAYRGRGPRKSRSLPLTEAHTALLSVAVHKKQVDGVNKQLGEVAVATDAILGDLRTLKLPESSGYLTVYHKAIAARVAALDLLARHDDGTAVLASAVSFRPAGEWKTTPTRPVLNNHAHLIGRLATAKRLSEARQVAEEAKPLLTERPNTWPADRIALARLRQAIASVLP